MSYLRFEKAVMTNLEESLRRELLRTNRSGAYSASTLVDCNTRKYHGLLVVPVPEIDDENHVLLSSLDCTVIQHGAEFNLGLHKYQGNNFSPNGHKYIREYDATEVPTTTYRVGGVILKKEIVFQHYEDRILIRYTLVDGKGFISVIFVSEDKKICYSVICKNDDKIANVEEKLFEKYPELKENDSLEYFINGKKFHQRKTLRENKISND